MSTCHKEWSNSSVSQFGAKRWASWLTCWWKMAILSDFQLLKKSGPTHQWANLEQRGEHHDSLFDEKWRFWVTFKFWKKVVQLISEPIWSKELSIMTHFLMKNGDFEWLSTFEKSGPTHQWANLEQRGEHHDSLFDEKWRFWVTFNFWKKVVQLISEPIWSKEVSIMTHFLMKNGDFEWLSTFEKKWSNSSVSQFGAKRWASWLTFWWKMAILSDFQLLKKSGPTHQWANLEQRGEHHDSLFDEKWRFWVTFNFWEKVVQLISEPIWSKEVSIMTHFLMKNGDFEWLSTFEKKWSNSSVSQFGAKRWASWLTFWWKMAILSDFQLLKKVVQLISEPIWSKEVSIMTHFLMKNGDFEWLSTFEKKWSNSSVSQFGAKRWASWLTFWWKMAILSDFQLLKKSGPTHQWANLEQRGEHHDSLFDEKWRFWVTFNFWEKVVQLISEPIWSKEVSIMTHFLMKNGDFEWLSTFEKKWSNSSVSQFGAKRWASWLTFWWKMAILSDFQLLKKSGPTHQWANLEQRGEHHDSLFDEKWRFWVTFNFWKKVVQLISEPIWSKEVSIMTHFLMKNGDFEWLSTFEKKWSNSSVSQFGAKRWASWLTFWWKMAILSDFQLLKKSGPTHQWANLEQRGEHHDSLFDEKWRFWVTFNFWKKVVQLISEPIWSKEVSIMTHFLMKNGDFEWLSTFEKKWSNSSVSQFGAKRWASWLTFWWKMAILSDFQLLKKSGPTHQWANLEQRGEHHDSLFDEKWRFWVTFNFWKKVVQLISEPIWSKEVSIMTHFLMKNGDFEWLSTFEKKWSNSSVSQFGAKRWASWLTFWWKMAILSDFQLLKKSGPTHQWANLEQRGEHHDSLFDEKWRFWVTFNFWSNSSVSQFGAKRWASWLTFWWKMAILSDFQKKWSNSSVSQFGAKRWASWLTFWWKMAILMTFNFWKKVVQLISEPIWSKEVSIRLTFWWKMAILMTFNFWKKVVQPISEPIWSKRWAWLTFWWKMAILNDFQLLKKSGPTHQWANLEQRGEHHDSLFDEKWRFWVTFNFWKKVVQLISEPIWSKEVSIMTHFLMKNGDFEWLSTFEKSGPTHQWANLEQRGEHHDSLFDEKWRFWVTFNFWKKVVQLISEPIWSKEVSIMTHFLMKNGDFEWLSTFEKKWSNSSVSQFGAKRWASWLTFWWKMAILSDFQLLKKVVQLISEPIWSKEVSIMTHFLMKNGDFEWLSTFEKKWSNSSVSQFGAKRWASWLTFWWKMAILSDFQLLKKSGPTHQWANLEQRGEHHDSLFDEKWRFWVTFNFWKKVVQLISEPIWSKEVSIMTHFLMKNGDFEWLSTFEKKWSNSSVSQFGAKRWASWLTFWWKMAILSDFQLLKKSGPTHQWANLEQRGEHHDSLFDEKWRFWVTFNFWKKWSNSSVSQFGAKRWASWLTFWWKMAILSDFQLLKKSGPTHQWANLEQRGEHHDSLFDEKWRFWVTFNFWKKVVQLISEPIWSKEVSIMTHFLMKNGDFEWLSTFEKKWSNSSVSQFGAKRWASWLTFWWKMAILSDFQLLKKSGPTHQWANLEQRGEHHDSLFDEKWRFWVTFNFWKKWSNSSVSQFGAKRWASWLTFWWKMAILSDFQLLKKSGPTHQWANLEQRGEHHDSLFDEKWRFWVTFNFWKKVVQLISEPIWSKEVSIMTHFLMKNGDFEWLSTFEKSGPTHQWANLEQRGEHHDSLFDEKWRFWVTFNFWKKVVQLISEPIWSKEVSIMTHFLMKNGDFEWLSTFEKKWSNSSVSQFGAKRWASWLTFWWKMAILSDFQLLKKSGPTHQWANLEQRGEHHDSLFDEKWRFWVTFNFWKKVVQLISEPIWSKEVSIMTHFLMKNGDFEWLSTFEKKWSNSSVSQFGAKRWASWLTFWWKMAILSDFQLLKKSGPTHQWANLEQRGEHHDSLFDEKWRFWVTFNFWKKVVQLISEPIWSKEVSIMTHFLMKNGDFEWLSTFEKKWSNSSVSQFGAKRWASWLTFWWKMAILSDFQLLKKSGPTHQWANLEQRGEHHDSLFDEKWRFWVTFNFWKKWSNSSVSQFGAKRWASWLTFWWKMAILSDFQLLKKVVQLISEPIWSKEVSIMTHFLMKNGDFEWLSTFEKKWSNSSVSQFGAKRWASWLTFWWKMAILSDFQLLKKSGPTHQWANLEQRGEHHDSLFDEKWRFWVTFNFWKKVVQLISEPIWSKEVSIMTHFLMKNGDFEWLSTFEKKWSNSSVSQFGAKRWASWLTFWWKMAILSDFQLLKKVVQLISEPIWSKEVSIMTHFLMKNGDFEWLSTFEKKWSNSSVSQFGAKRWASWLTFWWKMAILSDFQLLKKSGPTHQWANLEQRGEHHDSLFDEKWRFWVTFNFWEKVVQLISEPIWSKEVSIMTHFLMKNGDFEWLSTFEKSGPTHQWANLEQRGEHHDSLFDEKWRFWVTFNFWKKVVQLISEPIWSKEVSIMTHFLMKNGDFEWLSTFEKSGPTHQWANLEQRGEHHDSLFDEKWRFWVTFNFWKKWSNSSVSQFGAKRWASWLTFWWKMAILSLSTFEKKWSNSSVSQFGAKRWASWLTFWWKMAILSDFQLLRKSGPTHQWANLEQRGEHHDSLFDEKWRFWVTFNFWKKVVQLISEPIWSKEVSIMTHFLMKNGDFEWLSTFEKKWSNSSVSQFGAKRWASWLTFWWKMAILSDFQLLKKVVQLISEPIWSKEVSIMTHFLMKNGDFEWLSTFEKSGPTHQWANLEQRGEHHDSLFDEKWRFWVTFTNWFLVKIGQNTKPIALLLGENRPILLTFHSTIKIFQIDFWSKLAKIPSL